MLGIDVYLAKYKKGTEGLILNVASICGVDGYNLVPIYCATKHAVVGMTKSYGQQAFIDEVGVKVMAICPGFTMTPSLQNFFDKKDKVIKYHYRGFPDEELGKIQS